jgi:hypothetical protein
MKAALQFYTGTTEEWASINPKPYEAVWCMEITADGKRLLKIGNGEDLWGDLEYMDEHYLKGLPEKLDGLATAISDEAARAQGMETALEDKIDAEVLRAQGAEDQLGQAVEAAQAAADDNNLESGVLAGDADTLKITLTKAGGEAVEVSLAELKGLFLRRSATTANGTTALNNEPANDGFSALSTESDTNSIGGLETNTEAGNPVVAGMYLKHEVNPTDNVRILLMNNGTTKRAYLLKDKAVPLTRQDISGDDELWNKKEIRDAIGNAVAGLSSGLKMPVSLDLESNLPDPAGADAGDYYRISNMDVSAAGYSGEAWFNPDIATDAWQKTISTAFAPDGVTIELDGNGQLTIAADVQELIDGAVQEAQVLKTAVDNTATDEQVLSAKNIFDNLLGDKAADLRDGFTVKKVIPALNQLFDEDGKIKKPFTFLVDSDAALGAWAANTAGNDYTSVLIAPGTWTSAVEVDLTASGTRVVVGMPGSKLSFTSAYGLRYSSTPTANDYRMEGVNVEAANASGDACGFSNGANLTDCTAAVSSADGSAYGFSGCTGLTGCTAAAAGTVNGYGFSGCKGMRFNEPGGTSTTAVYNGCYVSLSGGGPAASDTALGGYNKGAGTPADPLPVANGGTGASTAEGARANLGLGGSGITEFTYLVDSNQKLADWANNVRTSGQDYTSVLIAPGTWTSAVEVNLTTSGTKVVVGMPGSLLSFTSQYGLRYTNLPKSTDYRMEGVNVSIQNGPYISQVFYRCTNLTSCTGTATGSGVYAFSECTNLINCTGTATGSGDGTCRAFEACQYLTNCTGTATGSGVGVSLTIYAFATCYYVTNCTGTASSTANGSDSEVNAFRTCGYLTNCIGTAIASSALIESCAFYECNNLTSCNGTGRNTGVASTSSASGFYNCYGLNNCIGTGTGITNSYGFDYCRGMVQNRRGGSSTTATYNNCSVSYVTGAVPDDNAAGGWNQG